MRLLCPNCGAQYEVDSSMIPDEGRDVQCSNCGKTWFQEAEGTDLGLAPPARQTKPEPSVSDPATDREAALDVAPDETPVAKEAAEFKAAIEARATTAEKADVGATGPAVDDSVLGILREEAEREIGVRRAEGLETQTELGLDDGADPEARRKDLRDRMARLREDDDDDGSEEDVVAASTGARSELLPDIEEINSSLSPAEDDAIPDPGDPIAAEAARRSGFRLGFMLMMLLAIVLVAAYAYAPLIARTVPAAEPIVIVYVDFANSARAGIDGAMARSAESLSGLIGNTQ